MDSFSSLRLAALVVVASIAAGATIGAARGGGASARTCDPISIVTGDGTFAYTVRIESGTIGCVRARAIIRTVADEWPASARWNCRLGKGDEPWGISCAWGGNLIRAYGPTLTLAPPPAPARDPWVAESQNLQQDLFRPSYTAGLTLAGVQLQPPCGGVKFTIVASYGTPGGTTLDVAEGASHTCGQLGLPLQLATWWIHGRPARLVEDCAPTGCARVSGDYALDWHQDGREITMFAHHFGQHELLAVARSLKLI